MYFFVRFTGVVIVIVGVLLMLFGFVAAIYGFVQDAMLVEWTNNILLAGSNFRLVDARFYAAIFGLGFFLIGMFTSGLGQLMLVFADVAANTKETNGILRGMRRFE
jgi:hypothetical protein